MTNNQKLSELQLLYRNDLKDHFPAEEIRSMFCIIAAHLLKYSKIDIHIKAEERISAKNTQKFLEILERLKKWEPLQYIIGETDFFNLRFLTDSRVLIPRQETWELVKLIIDSEQERSGKILDIGTGSACIAVSLAYHLKNCKVSACDVSEDILDLARVNALINNVNVYFFRCDLLAEDHGIKDTYNIFVSNPPYVRQLEKTTIKDNVLMYEPHSALFVPDNDPLLFYRKIAEIGRSRLESGGRMYLEINEHLPEEILALLAEHDYIKNEIVNDINSKARFAVAVKS